MKKCSLSEDDNKIANTYQISKFKRLIILLQLHLFEVSCLFPNFVDMIIQMHKPKPRMEELDFLKFVFITLMIAFHLTYIGDTLPCCQAVGLYLSHAGLLIGVGLSV